MIARKIFMVRPAHFGYNPETAQNNAFQHEPAGETGNLQGPILREFDNFVELLRSHSITVDVLGDDPLQKRFDAIFPNNWFSTHPGHILVTYPMFSPIRRKERDPAHIAHILSGYHVNVHISLEHFESEDFFLEGTGSLIIDHEYGIAYGNRSARTHEIPFNQFCQLMRLTPVLFDAADEQGIPVYHTNVVMGIGKGYVLINKSAVAKDDWPRLAFYFRHTDKEIIEISHSQMTGFLGNTGYLHNVDDRPYIVMSETAFQTLENDQKQKLSRFGRIIYSDLSTIERIGGGSAKCMIAENYLNTRIATP